MREMIPQAREQDIREGMTHEDAEQGRNDDPPGSRIDNHLIRGGAKTADEVIRGGAH
jgi:hypothetical protein